MAALSSIPALVASFRCECHGRRDVGRFQAVTNLGAFTSSLSRVWNAQRLVPYKMMSTTHLVFASEANPETQETVEEKKNGDSGGGGPPFLTILAGVVVFLFIIWVIGSILMWLIGLIVNVPSSS